MKFSEEQQTELFNYIDGNQMPSEETMAELLGINEENIIEAMVELGYEQCSDCGCWVEDSDGGFVDNDFVCSDCIN
ncbi:hypothetical protein JCM30760_26400 [Thiomicrorhabdus hydrogeniphila]